MVLAAIDHDAIPAERNLVQRPPDVLDGLDRAAKPVRAAGSPVHVDVEFAARFRESIPRPDSRPSRLEAVQIDIVVVLPGQCDFQSALLGALQVEPFAKLARELRLWRRRRQIGWRSRRGVGRGWERRELQGILRSFDQ